MAGLARADWSVWSCDASVVVTDAADLDAALTIVRGILEDVDRACSRFRADSELATLGDRLAIGVPVSPMLACLVEGALEAARLTDGLVDPTLGAELAALGYVSDLPRPDGELDDLGPAAEPRLISRTARWRDIALNSSFLTIPAGVVLDLGATAKAIAVDLAAARIREALGCGVLVSVGGDIATAGVAPDGGWQILVRDLPSDPEQQVTLREGCAVATSSTQKRQWTSGGFARHHILDPRFGLPAPPVWKSVTVSAPTCLRANALSTASIVLGLDAASLLNREGADARLVDSRNRVVVTGGWPDPTRHEAVNAGGAR